MFGFIGQAVVGWLIADFLVGLFHWWEDRVARQDMWLIGPEIVVPNRLHHTDQLHFLTSSLFSRNIATWIAVAAVSGLWLWVLGFSVVWVFATLGGAVANEVHALAHDPGRCGPALRALQASGVIQSPRHHQAHHRAGDRHYGVLTDWLNPFLDATGFYARIEAAMTWLGLEPNRGTE